MPVDHKDNNGGRMAPEDFKELMTAWTAEAKSENWVLNSIKHDLHSAKSCDQGVIQAVKMTHRSKTCRQLREIDDTNNLSASDIAQMKNLLYAHCSHTKLERQSIRQPSEIAGVNQDCCLNLTRSLIDQSLCQHFLMGARCRTEFGFCGRKLASHKSFDWWRNWEDERSSSEDSDQMKMKFFPVHENKEGSGST